MSEEPASEQPERAQAGNRHVGPLLALGLALALVVAAVVVAVVGGDDVSPAAVTVNGDRTSAATLDDELDGFASSDYFSQLYSSASPPRTFSASNGSISATGTAQWLNFRTQTMLAESILDGRGASLTDADVNAAKRSLAEQGVTKGMSSSTAAQLARFSASGEALADELGYDEYRSAMRRAARRSTIDLDPKYGRWNDRRLAFCVPAGCRAGGVTVVPPAQSAPSGQSGG